MFKKIFFLFLILLGGLFSVDQAVAAVDPTRACRCEFKGVANIITMNDAFGIDLSSHAKRSINISSDSSEGSINVLESVRQNLSIDVGCGTGLSDITCTSVTLLDKCLCRGHVAEDGDYYDCRRYYFYYGDGYNGLPSDLYEPPAELLAGGECENLKIKVDYKQCCCRRLNETEISISRQCKEVVSNKINQPPTCDATVFEGTPGSATFDPSKGTPQLFAIPKEGGCSALENEQKSTTQISDKKFDAGQQLAAEAAAALNPMNFKSGATGINDLIGRVIRALTSIIGSLLLLFYVYAGILWMTAQGSSDKIGKAKKIIVWSTLGVIVVLASYAIVKFVFSYVG